MTSATSDPDILIITYAHAQLILNNAYRGTLWAEVLSTGMPYFSHRILVCPCPFVNLDLFKKGFYHVSLRLVDQNAEQTLSRIECVEIRDLFGPELNQFSYPGACLREDHFITQTVVVEYTEQAFPLGECFLFKLDCPIKGDHTDAYIPSSLVLNLELKFSGDEELPRDPSSFSTVSSRTVHFTVDWRHGLHDHYPVLFDYFHMAAIGLTIHASLLEMRLDDYCVTSSLQRRGSSARASMRASSRPSSVGRRFSFQSPPPTSLPSLQTVLFGSSGSVPPTPSTSSLHPLRSFSAPADRSAFYLAPERQIERAHDAHQMLCDVLCSARESLHVTLNAVGCEQIDTSPLPEVGDLSECCTVEEAEELCNTHLQQLNASLAASWDCFYRSVISQTDMTLHLATSAHRQHMLYSMETLVSHEHPFFKNVGSIADSSCLSAVAARIRRSLTVPMVCYCKENVETTLNSCVVFVEPPSWPALEGGTIPLMGEASPLDSLPGTAPGLKGFSQYIHPYLMDSLPGVGRCHRTPGVHLVVCVHGLQGNQFDLRLYRIFLTMALPQVRFSFLMSSSNQADTFCDFNLMTDRLLEEVLDHVRDMPTPPSKVSFIGHSLGSITVRSLVTRPEFSSLISKLHLFLSICGPHLGTKFQNGIVSVGMWAVRKWYNSKSLLQLSLKDAPNPTDSFLYHLSEAPSLKYFRHVVLLASPQDKYVPYHSAKISTLTRDAAFQTSISLRIMQNILEPLRKAHVNLVRVSVDHAIPTSTNSVIGRAAHIAMLDNELFIKKLVSMHLAQYFIEA